MSKIHVNERVGALKQKLQHIGGKLIEASSRFGLNPETKEILETQLVNINDNFLFVITGEVNAGKSSFVNALLDSPICATSHEICTSRVQKITYGEEEQFNEAAEGEVARREFPAEILKQITIVDTPGTNSKELDHQLITERFIPHANLIVFVFMTENIHAETAWELFRQVKDKWGKKIIFVLSKKDMYTADQVESYKTTLKRYVENEGIDNPKIFATSAKQEQDGDEGLSGFQPLRQFINEEILEHAAEAKIEDDFKTLNSLFTQLQTEFGVRREKYQKDQATRDKITTILQEQEDNAKDSISNLTDQCLAAYDANAKQFTSRLSKEIGFFNLTLRSIRSIFGGDKLKDKLEQLNKDFATDLNRDINGIIESGTDNIKNDIQYMLTRVKNELDQLNELEVQRTQMFSHLDMQRNEIIHTLKMNLTNFIERSPLFAGKSLLKEEIDYSEANIASGAAAIGAAIGLIAQHSVLDVTGGIVTALALLVAGGFATFKKGKYMKNVRETLADNRAKLKTELEGQLLSYFDKIKSSVNAQFFEFDQALKTERVQIQNFEEVAQTVGGDLKALNQEIIS